jgi:hypothetical protein
VEPVRNLLEDGTSLVIDYGALNTWFGGNDPNINKARCLWEIPASQFCNNAPLSLEASA